MKKKGNIEFTLALIMVVLATALILWFYGAKFYGGVVSPVLDNIPGFTFLTGGERQYNLIGMDFNDLKVKYYDGTKLVAVDKEFSYKGKKYLMTELLILFSKDFYFDQELRGSQEVFSLTDAEKKVIYPEERYSCNWEVVQVEEGILMNGYEYRDGKMYVTPSYANMHEVGSKLSTYNIPALKIYPDFQSRRELISDGSGKTDNYYLFNLKSISSGRSYGQIILKENNELLISKLNSEELVSCQDQTNWKLNDNKAMAPIEISIFKQKLISWRDSIYKGGANAKAIVFDEKKYCVTYLVDKNYIYIDLNKPVTSDEACK